MASKLLLDHCVFWWWAPFQAYSDDSPLCVDLVIGLLEAGVLGVCMGVSSPWCFLLVAFVHRFFPARLVWNLEKQVLRDYCMGWRRLRICLGLAWWAPQGPRFSSSLHLWHRTRHGRYLSAVCSSATELFVHCPCTHGTALLLLDVHD